jgi:PAS domain S-box-containing protein
MGSLRVLIVDDQEAVRLGLRSLLSTRPDFLVCGEAADGIEAVEKAKSLRPDVVLMDVSMPRMNGIEAARILRREVPNLEVIIISQNDLAIVGSQARQAGAGAYIAKNEVARDLIPALDRLTVLGRVKPSSSKEDNTRECPEAQIRDLEGTSIGDVSVPVESILRTEELGRRPSRAPDYEKESRALVDLAQALADSPNTVLQTLAETLLDVCCAGSAGISLLTTEDNGKNFYWPAIAGSWKTHIGGGTPRDFGPCGDVLDRNATLLFSHVERRYTYFQPVTPLVEEALLVPFYVGGKAVGTIWVVAHDERRKFDAEDERIMDSLGKFASSAYQILASIDALEAEASERQKAERATTLLAAIVDFSDDAIISKSLNGIITSWNRAAERIFGYTTEQAIGQHITLIIPVDRHAEETKILERLKRGERIDHFETVRVNKDGTLLDVSLTISPVKDGNGNIIGASKVARDITERKRTESALRESQERFKAIVETTPECVKLVAIDGTLLHMNPPGLAMVGADCDEMVLGKNFYDFIASHDRERFQTFNEAVCSGERGALEFDIVGLDGTARRMETHAAPLRMVDGNVVQLAVTRDITERTRAQEVLRQSEERLRTLADGLEIQVRTRTQELEHRNEEVLQQSEQLRELSNRLVQTQDEERRRIARELHDSAGQIITALGMNLASMTQYVRKNPALGKVLDDSQNLVQQLNKEIRTTSYLLHPPLLDESGLPEAIRWYMEGLTDRSDLLVDLNISEDFGRLPGDMEMAVFRVVQECLTNIHRHSDSKTATLRLFRCTDGVVLEIQDAGKGMPSDKLNEIHLQRSGVGIAGMRERVRYFKGTMKIYSNGTGTKISVTLPIPATDIQEEENAFQDQASGIAG